jgi:hypothetical protein
LFSVLWLLSVSSEPPLLCHWIVIKNSVSPVFQRVQ